MSNILNILHKEFEKHRVIFWYDEQQNSYEEFKEIDLPEVEKRIVENNEFEIKYQILRAQPDNCFLLYFPNGKPQNTDNWLLDIELSNYVFNTDQESIHLQEMGLPFEFKDLIKEHIEFFRSKERRKKLSAWYNEHDTARNFKYKMVAYVLATENDDLLSLIQIYANSYFSNLDKVNADLEKYNLRDFLWNEIKEKYNYQRENQNIFEFIIDVFDKNFVLSGKSALHPDSRMILSRWRDSITMSESYVRMSDEVATVLDVENLLQNATLDQILEGELFQLTEKKIIFELANEVINQSISEDRFKSIIKTRSSRFWFKSFAEIYKALDSAFELSQLISTCRLKVDTAEQAVSFYVQKGYQIDYHYRRFHYHYRQSNRASIIRQLSDRLEKIYVNEWLFAQGNAFQALLNAKSQWDFSGMTMQRHFYVNKVKPILQKQKVFVIISDALRYECGVELVNEINKENRFHAELDFMLSALPSYTQLGMAGLLPHTTISLNGDSDGVLVDGISSQGTENRTRILALNTGKRAKAILAEDFKKLNKAERAAEVKNNDLIYIYHNEIDKVGDDKITESRVFEAVNTEIEYLVKLVKDITSANASRILITADHGFLFQASKVSENDFVNSDYTGNTFKENRRFVMGKQISGDGYSRKFQAGDLFVGSDADILVAKGINRFKVKGAGSQFVHGGASLQEIVIPLIEVSKGREDNVSQVDIDVIQSFNKITTNFLPVEFLQTEPISDKVLPTQIRAFIQTDDETIISDTFSFVFDSQEEDSRQRAKKHVFQMMSEAGSKYRKQTVRLVIQSPVPGTSRWKKYKEFPYFLEISFTNDFE